MSISPNIRLRYLLPALIALAMIFYGVVTSSLNTRDNLRDFDRVNRSRDYLLHLQDTLTHMVDLETGQRGFIVVGDERYLDPYYQALEKVDSDLNFLRALSENAEQEADIAAITSLIEQRKSSAMKAIEARRANGIGPAITLISEGGGKDQMNRLRELIDKVRIRETIRLKKADQNLVRNLEQTNRTVVVAGSVAIISGMVGAGTLLLFLSARHREATLKIEKEKAEEAARSKGDFLAVMSHEIRTPMNAILGFSELLHDSVTKPREKHYASVILSSGNSLLTLINDILDLSKIEAGKLEIQPEPVTVAKFAENLETLFAFRAAEKGLGYSVRIDPSVPPLLFFDALRLRQVLVNLTGNAIKFSREGSVNVVIHANPISADETLKLHIDVADTGIGIPREHLGNIFRPFYQVDSENSRQFQGTGLGLSISRRLVEAMQGILTVETILGKGSVFRVTLPTRLARRSEEHLAIHQDNIPLSVDFNRIRPATILVTNDDPLSAQLIRTYFLGTHHTLIEVEIGNAARDACLAFHPDLVMMDIRLPGTASLELLKEMRAQGSLEKIPFIALTASSVLTEDSAIRSRFDGMVEKPVTRHKLFCELARFLPLSDCTKDEFKHAEDLTHDPADLSHHDWSMLCDTLSNLEKKVWPPLARLVPAQGTMTFSAQLVDLAQQHICPPLASYARQLSEAAETMDFSESGRLLNAFPKIIADLRTTHD